MSDAPVFTLAMAAPADADRTLAALAREVYALASDLTAFGPEAERVLATALAERHPDRIAGIVAICAMLLPSGVTFPEFTAPFVAEPTTMTLALRASSRTASRLSLIRAAARI